MAFDFVRDLSGETVELESDDGKCTISSGSDSCELVTIDPDEFPVVAHFEEQDSVSLQGGTFTTLVTRTSFAAAKEQGRYAMHGVLTEIEAGCCVWSRRTAAAWRWLSRPSPASPGTRAR